LLPLQLQFYKVGTFCAAPKNVHVSLAHHSTARLSFVLALLITIRLDLVTFLHALGTCCGFDIPSLVDPPRAASRHVNGLLHSPIPNNRHDSRTGECISIIASPYISPHNNPFSMYCATTIVGIGFLFLSIYALLTDCSRGGLWAILVTRIHYRVFVLRPLC
jgi:hypothetical protein